MSAEAFWMNAKKDGQCVECEDDISKGSRMVWDPKEFKAYCTKCGEDVAGDDPRGPK